MLVNRIISITIGVILFGVAVVLWARPNPVKSRSIPIEIKTVSAGIVEETVFQR